MTDVLPTQIAAFSYHFWRIDSELDALPAKEVRKQVQAAITRLYEWLGLQSAFIVEPLRSTGSPHNRTEWFRTPGALLASTTDARKAGYADCHSTGGTVSLTVATILNAPSAGDDIGTISTGHWSNPNPEVPYLGSQTLWGANFEAELTPNPSALNSLAKTAFGIPGKAGWEKWLNPAALEQVFISSAPQGTSDVVMALSGAGKRAQPATLQLARDLLPDVARFSCRAIDFYENFYLRDLSDRLQQDAARLARFRTVELDLDKLEGQISNLTIQLANYDQACAELYGHRQSIRVDRENMSTYLYRHDLPRSGWFADVDRNLQRMERQLEADASYADIQFKRAQSFMTAMDTRANILRAQIEREENTLLSRQTLRLTGIGLVVGLGQIIDRDTGKEFVAWLNTVLGTSMKESGHSLFLARVGLVLGLSACALIAGRTVLLLIRGLLGSSRN